MIDRTLPTLLTLAAGFTIAVVVALVYVAVDRWDRRRKARRAAAIRAERAARLARMAPAVAALTPAFAAMTDAIRNAAHGMAQVQAALEPADGPTLRAQLAAMADRHNRPGTPGHEVRDCWRNDHHDAHTWRWHHDDPPLHCPGIEQADKEQRR